MSDLIPFDYDGRPLRAFDHNGAPWLVGRDVCAILDITDPRSSLNLLDADERDTIPVTDALGREQDTIVISEAGFYSLVLRSRKPEAKAFRRWVTHEVLPSIRKTGAYGQPAVAQIGRRELAQMVIEAEDRADAAEKALAAAAPKVEAHDEFMSSDGCYAMGAVAQMLGLGQNALFARLRDEHILISGGRRHNTPYQQYVHHFKVAARVFKDEEGVDHASYTTYVRTSGVGFIRKALKMPAPIGGAA